MGGTGLDRRWRTAFYKLPVTGPVRLREFNLDGDGQGDRRVHGGPDMAVLCYSADHYPQWREELGLPDFPYGAFGENFTVAGATEWDACIGDVLAVGEAFVQVSQPRGPCWKISQRWRRPDLLERVESSGRHGWYLRVLREGDVEAGQGLELVERPHPQWTVRRAADAYRWRKANPAEAALLASCDALAERVRRTLLAGS